VTQNPITTCSNCGAPARVVRGIYQFKESGLPNVSLMNIDMIRCKDCGNEDPIIPRMNELMSVLALAVIKKPCPLNGKEVRFLRKFLRMTAEQFAAYVDVTRHHVSKWENGADRIGDQSDRLIRAVALCLGDNLKGHIEEIVRAFPDIEETIRAIQYQIDAETKEVQYI
jgi:DNA-binding transcriptional regulator YiaG